MATRTPEEIRASIEANRLELAVSVQKLRNEVAEVTDWRKQLRANQQTVVIGAAVVGFVAAGGVAAIGSLFTRRSRRRAARGY
jgi:ribulose kinase